MISYAKVHLYDVISLRPDGQVKPEVMELADITTIVCNRVLTILV